MRVWAVAVLLLSSAQAHNVQAECAFPSLTAAMTDSSTAWVFSGRVREITTVTAGQIATIDVDRVWKGAVPARVVVYYTAIFDGIALQLQERYLVFAGIQSPAERARFGVTDLKRRPTRRTVAPFRCSRPTTRNGFSEMLAAGPRLKYPDELPPTVAPETLDLTT